MNTKKFIIGIIAATILLSCFTECNKYPDGPKFSLRTRKSRLIGNWKINSITDFRGVDITADFLKVAGDYEFDIIKGGNYKIKGNFPDEGTWKLGGDKDDAYLQSSKPGAEEVAYRLLRLENTDLWARTSKSNGEVTIWKFKQ